MAPRSVIMVRSPVGVDQYDDHARVVMAIGSQVGRYAGRPQCSRVRLAKYIVADGSDKMDFRPALPCQPGRLIGSGAAGENASSRCGVAPQDEVIRGTAP